MLLIVKMCRLSAHFVPIHFPIQITITVFRGHRFRHLAISACVCACARVRVLAGGGLTHVVQGGLADRVVLYAQHLHHLLHLTEDLGEGQAVRLQLELHLGVMALLGRGGRDQMGFTLVPSSPRWEIETSISAR